MMMVAANLMIVQAPQGCLFQYTSAAFQLARGKGELFCRAFVRVWLR
jgi:hypothetical protein